MRIQGRSRMRFVWHSNMSKKEVMKCDAGEYADAGDIWGE